MYNFEPIITKEFIFKHISQEQIFQYYLNHSTIELRKKIYTNTLRGDNKPDCSYDIGSFGDLMFRDFALGKSYSCFQIVQDRFGIDYKEALRQIAIDFNLIKNDKNINYNNINSSSFSLSTIFTGNIIKDNRNISEIKVKKVDWNEDNKKYWNNYYFQQSTLDIFKVNPISHYWVNDTMFEVKNSYTYYHGFDKVHRRTILNLDSSNYKWIKNLDSNTVQGYNMIPKHGDLLILSKSYKDIMTFYEYNIPAVSTNAEGVPFKEERIKEFKNRFSRVVLMIDADTQNALDNSIKLSNQYNVPAIYLPEQLNKNSKDISGCRKNIGVNETGRLIQQLFNL